MLIDGRKFVAKKLRGRKRKNGAIKLTKVQMDLLIRYGVLPITGWLLTLEEVDDAERETLCSTGQPS